MVKFNIISVVICLGVVSVSEGEGTSKAIKMSISKFGCVFDNEDYFVRTNSIFSPVYGEQVVAMEFSNMDEFQPMLNGINAEYSELLKDLVFTNILDFYEFYDGYKNHGQRLQNTGGANLSSLISFYDNYTPRFIPRHGDASMAVELLDRLIRRYPEIAGSVHLVTSSLNAKETNWIGKKHDDQHYRGRFSNEEPPRTFVHNNVAAILRIRVEGKFGFVLMDPGNGIVKPETFFESRRNAQSPSQGYVVEQTRVRRGHRYYNVYQIYYTGKPYCSFLMTTTKPNILDTSLKIVRRNRNGTFEATITFDVTVDKPSFYMYGNVNFMKDLGPRQLTISFGVPRSMNQRLQKEIIEKVNYPGLPELLHKAEAIATDKAFLEEFANLVQRHKNRVG